MYGQRKKNEDRLLNLSKLRSLTNVNIYHDNIIKYLNVGITGSKCCFYREKSRKNLDFYSYILFIAAMVNSVWRRETSN